MAVTGVILYIFAKYSSDFFMDFRYFFLVQDAIIPTDGIASWGMFCVIGAGSC